MTIEEISTIVKSHCEFDVDTGEPKLFRSEIIDHDDIMLIKITFMHNVKKRKVHMVFAVTPEFLADGSLEIVRTEINGRLADIEGDKRQ